MIQCETCEFCRRDEHGAISFSCDPFATIKEPECLLKWQLLRTSQMVEAYQATLGYYHKLAPMQDKLFKAMERELNEMEDGEQWKQKDDEPEEPDELDEKNDQDGPDKPRW